MLFSMNTRCALAGLVLVLSLSCGGTGPAPAQTPQGGAATPSGRLSSIGDLKDKRIGVVTGTVYDSYANRNFPQATVLQFDSQADLRQAVLAGKADAGMSDEE